MVAAAGSQVKQEQICNVRTIRKRYAAAQPRERLNNVATSKVRRGSSFQALARPESRDCWFRCERGSANQPPRVRSGRRQTYSENCNQARA